MNDHPIVYNKLRNDTSTTTRNPFGFRRRWRLIRNWWPGFAWRCLANLSESANTPLFGVRLGGRQLRVTWLSLEQLYSILSLFHLQQVSLEKLYSQNLFNNEIGKMPKKVPSRVEATALELEIPRQEWKPRREEYLVLVILSMLSLMTALDATVLTPALPVSSQTLPWSFKMISGRKIKVGFMGANNNPILDFSKITKRFSQWGVLGRNLIPPEKQYFPTIPGFFIRHLWPSTRSFHCYPTISARQYPCKCGS